MAVLLITYYLKLITAVLFAIIMNKLTIDFYQREDVWQVAEELLGKLFVTRFRGVETAGRIVECEVYAGVGDKASHAYGGRRTARNEAMYAAGGITYVYLCYGIHYLVNVVTGKQDVPHAILLRGLEPVRGIPAMLRRTGKPKPDHSLTRGPGNLTKALGIDTSHNAQNLLGKTIWLEDDGTRYSSDEIAKTPRIGVDYAAEDALLPYRYIVKGNPYVSGKKTANV